MGGRSSSLAAVSKIIPPQMDTATGIARPAIALDINGQQRDATYDDVRGAIGLPPWHQCLSPKDLRAAQAAGFSEKDIKHLQMQRAAGTGFIPASKPGGFPRKLPRGSEELHYEDLRQRLGLPSPYINLKPYEYVRPKDDGYSKEKIDELKLRAAEGAGLDSFSGCCCCGVPSKFDDNEQVAIPGDNRRKPGMQNYHAQEGGRAQLQDEDKRKEEQKHGLAEAYDHQRRESSRYHGQQETEQTVGQSTIWRKNG